jgi:peptide-methionine (S)-S-oxide reductase
MKTHKLSFAPALPMMLVFAAIIFSMVVFSLPGRGQSEVTQEVTAPAPPGMQTATFAAGCFWSMQAIFQQLKGVIKVDPGYAGGTAPHPSYDEVEEGNTGYAETANITFDPKIISYNTLLRVLLTVRNPTTPDQQGPDIGTNYRSIIFYRSPKQQQEAEAMIQEINAEHFWQDPIVTTVQPYTTFWRAEAYHLDYYAKHPDQPYCLYVIAPEIAAFRAEYPQLLKPAK